MITFHSPTVLPIEAATTMGVSVKESDNAIGKFGTGLKYAIAGVLRLGGRIRITIEGQPYLFTAKPTEIRGKAFSVVHCNDVPCGFTTDLGKHWEPWQLFRELASNSLDEGGSLGAAAPADAVTVIDVRCPEVEAAGRDEGVFLRDGLPVLLSGAIGATVHETPSRHYYFRGIRAGSFPCEAPVTVNVTNGSLSEDRLLDLATVRSELAWAVRVPTTWDREFMRSVITQGDVGDFWVDNLNPYIIQSMPHNDLMDWLDERPKTIAHPHIRKAYRTWKESRGGAYVPCEWPAGTDDLVTLAERLCTHIGVDIIPRNKLFFTRDLDDGTLAVTMTDSRQVWLSTKLAMMGRDEFLAGYLEEAVHAMTGLADETRAFQNVFIGLVVRLGLRAC